MLRLINIKTTDKTAQVGFIPEAETIHGHIVVGLETQEIIQLDHVLRYEIMHPANAARMLIRMAEENAAQTERRVMWY